MMQISRGQRLKLSELGLAGSLFTIEIDCAGQGLQLDVACFGLDSARKLSDERYMTFFNQPATPCGAVRLQGTQFAFDLARLPATIDALVLTLAIDGAGVMSKLGSGSLKFRATHHVLATCALAGSNFASERAVMLVELYRKDGAWRINHIGQGFNGGLDALIRHFGGTVDEAAPPAHPPASPSASPARPPAIPPAASASASEKSRISLEKRVEREAPHLVSLIKKVSVSLDKAGLADHKARLALCLDISGSMSSLYRSGQISAFTDRILALAARFDDDGQLDVFLFGTHVHQPEPMDLASAKGYIERLQKRYPLEGGTDYGQAMAAIRRFYFPDSRAAQGRPQAAALPVYVMFLTDGQTSNEDFAERQVQESSFEPLFWQFMGIGRSSKPKTPGMPGKPSPQPGFFASLFATDFAFLEKLDAMTGRYLDNANFFSVLKPDEFTDEVLYDLLLGEYKDWLPQARKLGLLSSV